MQDAVVDACSLINLLASGMVLLTRECPGESKFHGRRLRAIQLDPPETAGKEEAAKSGVSSSATPSGLNLTLHIPSPVVAETLYVLRPDDEDTSKLVKVPIDLLPLFDAGLIYRCEPQGPEELALFVGLATSLDDGEAACLALAKTRGWKLATDDRLAARFAFQLGVSTLTTPEVMRHWADRTKAADDEIARALHNIQRFARFTPRADSTGYSWWSDKLAD